MSRLGILNPGSLLGQELKGLLAKRRDLWSTLELLTLDGEDYATVSEVAGEAVLVKAIDGDVAAALDVLFVCPGELPDPAELAPRLEGAGTVVYVSPTVPVAGGVPVVDGVNLDAVTRGATLVSPHPGAVILAHLLRPLLPLGLRQAVAWVVVPASGGDQAGIDELLDQTRRLLAFDSELPSAVFGRRLAHNLYPAPGGAALAASVHGALGADLRVAVDIVQAAVFHSVAVSAYARCAADASPEAARLALADDPWIQMPAADDPGPVEAAGSDKVLAGEVRPDPRQPGGLWLWGAADNLTVAGAGNALAIAEALLAPAG